MPRYQGISFCTGILGFELGMQLAGLHRFIEVTQCVEINRYCQELIRLRLPGVPIWDDLTTYEPPELDGDSTIIWSGFPCQPVSGAGKQRGADDKRYLWPYILQQLRQIRPVCWVGENVDGLRTIDSGRLFASILQDLSESGFVVEWSCVSAAEVGAVHKRERIWIIAYRPEAIADTNRIRCGNGTGTQRQYPDLLHQEWATPQNQQSGGGWFSRTDTLCSVDVADAESQQFERRELPTKSNQWDNSTSQEAWSDIALVGGCAEFANTDSAGFSQRERCSKQARWHELGSVSGSWQYENAQPFLCRHDDGVSSELDRYLLRHDQLEQWLGASTIPTFTRLTSAEVRSLSQEDQIEYKRLYKEYQRVKREYENWLEALGNAICPHQAAVTWARVGQILGLC